MPLQDGLKLCRSCAEASTVTANFSQGSHGCAVQSLVQPSPFSEVPQDQVPIQEGVNELKSPPPLLNSRTPRTPSGTVKVCVCLSSSWKLRFRSRSWLSKP